MKIVSTSARYLLGLLFTVFGLNGFLGFIPQPPPATVLAGQFYTVVATSHFMVMIFAVQLIAGVLLLSGRYVPLALVLLAGVIANILDFHLTMDMSSAAPGIVATVLWAIVAYTHRASFRELFSAKIESASA